MSNDQETEIVLTTINAKWIHPSLALRLLKANLGELEDRCEIIEFALRQPLQEKIDGLFATKPRILGISVSIWNHTATIELIKELKNQWKYSPKTLLTAHCSLLPIIVLGGHEVSYLPENAEIFKFADYVVRGEGEVVFRGLCEKILAGNKPSDKFIEAEEVNVNKIKTAYHLYTDDDVTRKLIYVESSRGCPFGCEFCLSAVPQCRCVRNFELVYFLKEIDVLIQRSVKTFKFLDRTFNSNIKRAIEICEFFIKRVSGTTFTVHFEMVPTLIVPELIETLSHFPPNSLRLEIGIQTLNAEVAERINLPGRRGKTSVQILEPLRLLREKTNAIIHADLIAGLPGEDLDSFGKGFDALLEALLHGGNFEVQLGILKLLPGTPISRHNEAFGMRFNPDPPYEVLETSSMGAQDIDRLKNYARFWELLVNRGLVTVTAPKVGATDSVLPKEQTLDMGSVATTLNFSRFMALSDALFARFGRNWGIDKDELLAAFCEVSLEI